MGRDAFQQPRLSEAPSSLAVNTRREAVVYTRTITAAVCILHSINFNQDASLICVSSDHGTVHIFAAEDPKRNKQSR